MKGILVTGFALFAMFFGAGNLILPAMLGVNAGGSAWVAIFGFLATGVLLPVAGMVAMATQRKGEKLFANRIGSGLGWTLTLLIFLSTGMLYAIPRIAAVSFEMAVAPLTGPSSTALITYTIVFFAAAAAVVLHPSRLVEVVGGWLTPVLLVLLVMLIVGSFTLDPQGHTATGAYAGNPFAAGVVEGYFTMDAIAALVFGTVITMSLAQRGFHGKRNMKATAMAGVIAGLLLALVYLGLVQVGQVGNGSNGAAVIAGIATAVFGRGGQVVFGLIAVLACFTTSVGLLSASTDYFNKLVPSVDRRLWLAIHLIVALPLSNLGLERILQVVAPLNQLLYPVTIVLILVALLDAVVPTRFFWAYRLPAWTAAVISVPVALVSTGAAVFAPVQQYLSMLPLGAEMMPWVVPSLVMFVVGYLADAFVVKADTVAAEYAY